MDKDIKRIQQAVLATLVLVVLVLLFKAVWKEEQSIEVEEYSSFAEVESERLIRPKQPEIIIVEEETEEIETSENDVLRELGKFRVTAYCPCEKCCGKWANTRPNGIVYGASGEELVPYCSIAVDTDIIPYGKSVFIDGIEYVAHDCGGAVKGNCIDIYMDSHEAAVEFGVKNMMVYERKY